MNMGKTRYVKGYVLRVTDNSGHRTSYGRYYKKRDANKELRKLMKPATKNKYGIYRTRYRDALSGGGINNPRIKKVRLIR